MREEIRFKFAKRLKELREKYGYTQEDLAERANIEYKHIQKLEGRNPHNPRLDTLEKIAKAFNISLSKLLDFK